MALDPAADDRFCRHPHVEVRVERAGYTFDDDHGLLQKQQLWLGLHVELRSDLEQLRQQTRHRNLVRGPIHDRFANGADSLREDCRIMLAWHVAGLEMDLAHPQIVAGDEAIEDLGQEHAFLRPEPPDDTEVDGNQVAGAIHEQVSLVHVGMKEAVADGMAQEALDHRVAQLHEVEALGTQRLDIGNRRAIDPLGGQHFAPGAFPIDLRHAKPGVILGVLRHLGQGRCFHAQVQFLLHGLLQHLYGGHRPQPAAFRAEALHQAGGEIEASQVGRKPFANAWPQHLHRKIATIRAARLVHLRDGSGCDGRAEFGEQYINRCAEVFAHDLPGGFRGKWRQPVLQRLQIESAAGPHQIGPGRQELAKLDVAGTERRECGRHRHFATLLGSARAELRHRQSEARCPGKLRDLLRRHQGIIGGQRAARAQKGEAVPDI